MRLTLGCFDSGVKARLAAAGLAKMAQIAPLRADIRLARDDSTETNHPSPHPGGSERAAWTGRSTMGGTLGPAHRKVPRLCRVIGWFEPGLPGGSPVRDFRRPLSRGACTPSRGRTPVYVTRLATVASHHAQRREALPTFIGPPILVGRQSPARPSRTAPSRAVSRSTRSRS